MPLATHLAQARIAGQYREAMRAAAMHPAIQYDLAALLRIQGARLLAEYDNTSGGANHIHTVWREPVGDFGRDLLARH